MTEINQNSYELDEHGRLLPYIEVVHGLRDLEAKYWSAATAERPSRQEVVDLAIHEGIVPKELIDDELLGNLSEAEAYLRSLQQPVEDVETTQRIIAETGKSKGFGTVEQHRAIAARSQHKVPPKSLTRRRRPGGRLYSIPTVPETARDTKFETELFAEHPEAKMWLGIVASREVEYADTFRMARILRANVYIDEWSFLAPEARQADGGESDKDDERSTHFAAIENLGNGRAAIAGNIRLIGKSHEDDLLPIERHFPEAFAHGPAPVTAVEASRFIASHPDKRVQSAISIGLMRTAATYALLGGMNSIHAVAEKPLQRRFALVGLPHEILSGIKPLREYNNTENMAIHFDPRRIRAAVEADVDRRLLITPFFQTAPLNGGQGYYKDHLLQPIQ